MTHPISSSASQSVNIAENLRQIQKNIVEFCQRYNRNPDEVQLLAVSKTKPASDIRTAFTAGQTHFGENYLQEALSKINEVNEDSITWHFIGAIQSNKTRDLAEHFDWVHSVDRFKIARRLSEQRPTNMPPLNICLEVNISEEASKAGLTLNQLEAMASEIMPLPNIKLRGLMAIPAKADSLQQQREIFSQLKQALLNLQKKYPQLDTLSMGMSGDMEAAIAEGSTIVRIGTAIFGARNT